jgi:hypothetical protein
VAVPAKASDKFNSAVVNKPAVLEGARHIRALVKYVATALGIGFAWLRLSHVDFRPVAADVTAALVFHTTMALFVICWVRGLYSDTDQQELVYVAEPDKLHAYTGSSVMALSIFLAFVLLCLTYVTTLFAYSLLIFHVVNIGAWIYLSKVVMRREFVKSMEIYRRAGEFFHVEQLRVVYERYLDGSWQIKRFAAGGAVALAAIAFRYVAATGQAKFKIRGYSFDTELAIALLFLLYVVVMEVWIWRERIRMSAQMGLINELRKTYTLAHPESGAPAEAT